MGQPVRNLPNPKSLSSAERGEMNMLVHHDLGFSHRACDRCHGQKLRCRRESNNRTCIRCAKAGAHCTPRPMSLRPRADPVSSSQKQRQSRHHGDRDIPRQLPAVPERDPNEPDKGKLNDFHHLNYLDSSTDINLGFDSSLSQAAELHPALAPPYGTPAADSQGHGRRASQQSLTQPPSRSGTAKQPGQTRWDGVSGRVNPDFMYDLSASPTSLSLFSSGRHHMSPPRDMSLSYTHQQAPFDMITGFDETIGQSKSSENKGPDTDPSYGNDLSPSDLLRFPDNDALDSSSEHSSREMEDIPDPNPGPHHSTMTSWIRGLTDTNVQLFQHMHSIPATETGQQKVQSSCSGSSSASGSGGGGHTRLAVDCTFRLSAQYTELLTNLCALLKSHGACHDAQTPHSDLPVLDEPSLCIVLSSYMYLLESYYKILQRMKAWMEAQLNMAVSRGGGTTVLDNPVMNLGFPMELPGLSVGSFEPPKASPISPIVLACIVDTNVRHMHSLISIIMSPASDSTLKTGDSGNRPPLEEGSDDPTTRLPSVAKIILQAVKPKEDSTLKLVQVVSQLALKCFTAL
ncbi:hypothetical protein F4818DRAFT_304055 [Hypoxylon cercidicola]|nr:hypothetical protein F4818DRAFT_304055 [Hypoxylon cercidicola]